MTTIPFNQQLSIVIPVHDEQDCAPILIKEIAAAIPSTITYEIIVVDDHSKDKTWGILTAMCAQYPNLRLLQHQTNCGQSAAVITGVKAARYDWIATLDGDGQNDPKDIPELIQTLRRQPDEQPYVIAGHRVTRKDTFIKKMSSRVANKVRGRILKDDCPDTGCGIKLFPRDLFLALPHFNHIHRFIPAMFQSLNVKTINVAVNHRQREFGRSKYGLNNRLWVGISDMLGVIWLKKRHCHALEVVEHAPAKESAETIS
jgi:dolichol-phosphate mannosyltransferase